MTSSRYRPRKGDLRIERTSRPFGLGEVVRVGPSRVYYIVVGGMVSPSRRPYACYARPATDAEIANTPEEIARREAEAAVAAYEALRAATIPAGYASRHGSLYGGIVTIGNEAIEELAIGVPSSISWALIGSSSGWPERHLYTGSLPDGTLVVREAARNYDDIRETYWLPAPIMDALLDAEAAARNITVDEACEWIARYGPRVVGHELYERVIRRFDGSDAKPELGSASARLPKALEEAK